MRQNLDLKKIEGYKNLSLQSIAELYGLRLRRAGDKFKTLCPFHNEQGDPSLFFYPDDTFYCFGGSCHKSGDKAKFVAFMEDVPVNYIRKTWNLQESKSGQMTLTFKEENDIMYIQTLKFVSVWCRKHKRLGHNIPDYILGCVDDYINKNECTMKIYNGVVDFLKTEDERYEKEK